MSTMSVAVVVYVDSVDLSIASIALRESENMAILMSCRLSSLFTCSTAALMA